MTDNVDNQFMEMAPIYGRLHDSVSLFWCIGCISRWKIHGVCLMEFQIIIGYAIGLFALLYVIQITRKQFTTPDVDSKCDDCPVIDNKNNDNN